MEKTAKPILFALFPGLQVLDVTGPAEVFAQANRQVPGSYKVTYASWDDSVPTSIGTALVTTPFPGLSAPHHTVIVPGGMPSALKAARDNASWMAWLQTQADQAKRVTSVCSGALILAELGALDGRRATTHWDSLDFLRTRFPKVTVERDALYVEDGPVWTSAGVTAGIDMALALVGRDLGQELALRIARNLVVFLLRPGGQAQFSGVLDLQSRAGPDLAHFPAWLEDHLHEDLSVETMANAMAQSPRSFHRRCVAQFGDTPARLLMSLRLDRARALMSNPARPLKTIATDCGFKDAASFSTAFTKRFGVSPSAYRNRFVHPRN